jgi:hypothetical protein
MRSPVALNSSFDGCYAAHHGSALIIGQKFCAKIGTRYAVAIGKSASVLLEFGDIEKWSMAVANCPL